MKARMVLLKRNKRKDKNEECADLYCQDFSGMFAVAAGHVLQTDETILVAQLDKRDREPGSDNDHHVTCCRLHSNCSQWFR